MGENTTFPIRYNQAGNAVAFHPARMTSETYSIHMIHFVHRFFAYLFEKANTVSVLNGDSGRTIGEGNWG